MAVVVTTLLYGSEAWVTYRNHIRFLERFHQRCLRSILKIHWSDYVTNIQVLEQAGVPCIETMLIQHQLRWAGHVSRMEDHRLPKMVLFGELSSGHRQRGAPKKRYKDHLKRTLISCGIDHLKWTELASERDTWRQTLRHATTEYENHRREAHEIKRQKRKSRAASATYDRDPSQTFICPRCARPCLSRIGLVSHERACTRRGHPP